jgi:beta propeller repeat protein
MVVWVDTSNGWDKLNLYMYDLSTHKETKIVTNASDSVLSVSIYDDKVVWTDTRPEKSFIRMYNISTGRIINITCNRSSDEPNIYGDRVVWRDYRHGGNEIYMATLINPPIAASSTFTTRGKNH